MLYFQDFLAKFYPFKSWETAKVKCSVYILTNNLLFSHSHTIIFCVFAVGL